MPRGPNGLTHRQERFCHAFVEWGSANTAAKEAGYAVPWARNHGYRLLRQPPIRARIAQLQAEMAHDTCRDLDQLLGKLETVYRRALDDHHFYAAARAVDLQAKLAGRRAAAAARMADGTAGPGAQAADFASENAEMTTHDDA